MVSFIDHSAVKQREPINACGFSLFNFAIICYASSMTMILADSSVGFQCSGSLRKFRSGYSLPFFFK